MIDADFLLRIQQQLFLVSMSVTLAVIIGVPLSLLCFRHMRVRSLAMSLSAVMWTIPSLALLAMLIPFLGIGFSPAITVLTLYALLPILRSSITGLVDVPAANILAARGLGLTLWQRLYVVELPLAMPAIINGIRTAAIISVGIATLAAFVGAGGLGDYINRGLATNNTYLILLGALPAAALALLYDYAFASCEKLFDFRLKTHPKSIFTKLGVVLAIALICGPLLMQSYQYFSLTRQTANKIVIASKNFSEQFILAELMAQLIEAKTELRVERKLNLGTTAICHQALLAGEIDIYPEYSGTALLTVLQQPYQVMDALSLYNKVKQTYAAEFQLSWLKPFGFENSQTLAIRKAYAEQQGINSISELLRVSPGLTMGAPAEFLSREDAMPQLQKHYGLSFKRIVSLDPGIVYKALAEDQVDVIMAFSTDARIAAFALHRLEDDKQVFPSYLAAPVARQTVLQAHPEIETALLPLLGLMDETTMRQLNAEIDIAKQPPAVIAQAFLQAHDLI